MDRPSLKIEYLGKHCYRVCSPGGGLCVDSDNPYRAATVAKALAQCSSHSSMVISRPSDQNC